MGVIKTELSRASGAPYHPGRGSQLGACTVALDPIYVRWLNKPVRVRHDDPRLSRYSDVITRLQAAMFITTEVGTLRQVMAMERGYDVQVLEDGTEVRLRRRA